MPRIAPAEPPYSASVQANLDALMPKGVPPLWLFRVLARDERLYARSMGAALLDRGHLTLRERELVILRVCANNRSEYEWGVHVTAFSAKAGLTQAEVEATLAPSLDMPFWTTRDRLVLALCDTLQTSTQLDDAQWEALRREYSEEALIELLLLTGFYRTISTLTNTLQMPLEDFAARFPV